MSVSSPSKPRRMGLVLCGGGITGAIYEVACLAALEDAFEGFRASDFDVYVGVSSGATVATVLAGGHSAQRLYRALLDPADDFFPLQRQHLLRFDSLELKRVVKSVFGALRRSVAAAASHPLSLDLWNEIDRFYDSLPAGLFTVDAYERFFGEVMARRGIPKSFSELRRELLVIANDLDAGERAVFGAGDLAGVPVPRAVSASFATPVLFAPVRVEGRDYVAGDSGAGHLDLLAERGCDAVLVINPVVPVLADRGERRVPTGHGPKKRVRDKGLLWVSEQSVRILSEARLRDGIRHGEEDHPEIDVILLEPDRDNATMFMHSPMNFAARRSILEEGYVRTLRSLRDPSSPLRKILERRGLVARVSQAPPRM